MYEVTVVHGDGAFVFVFTNLAAVQFYVIHSVYLQVSDHRMNADKSADNVVQDTEVILRGMDRGRQRTCTGPGFMRVSEGSSLEFIIDEIPVSMDYDILVRYERQVMLVNRCC